MASLLPAAGDVWWVIDAMAAVPAVRRAVAARATELGYAAARTAEVEIVVSELATNLVRHAGGGELVLRAFVDAGTGEPRLRVLAIDSGPGSRNIRALIADGSSTSDTLGIGLGACMRLSTALDIYSVPAVGTIVEAELARGAETAESPAPTGTVADLTRSLTSDAPCGDTVATRRTPYGWVAMVADGLGHGPLAAEASQRAVAVLSASDADGPADLLQQCHASIPGTRGAAIAVVTYDAAARSLRHAGVGNIVVRLVAEGVDRSLPSQPGIVGHRMPRLRETSSPVEDVAAVVMHSDGLSHRWSLADLPGVLRHEPAVGCAALIRAAATRRDDASVLILRTAAS